MQDIANTWCTMWNDDPALAAEVATGDIRVWFGGADTPGLAGRDALTAFVERYRAGRGIRFTPLTVATDDSGERMAYTWSTDAGITGLDLCVLRDGQVAENFSIAAPRANDLPPAPAVPGDADLAGTVEAWPRLWNGELEAADLVAPDFRIWFGAAGRIDGAPEFAAFLREHEGRTYANHGTPVLDTARQLAATTWTVRNGRQELGGIDLLQFAGGRLSRVWSVTGEKALPTSSWC